MLFLFFLAALATPGLQKSYAQSPTPYMSFGLLHYTVPPGEYLNAGLLLRFFPCIDEDYDSDCDYNDSFTSVTYRFDILSRSDDTSPDICEGQGLNKVWEFEPAFYSPSSRLNQIPLRVKRECQPGPYTLKLTVTYLEADQETRVTLTDTVDFDVGDPQPPTVTPTSTVTPTQIPVSLPEIDLPIPTATPTQTPVSLEQADSPVPTATATHTPKPQPPTATPTATATPTQTTVSLQQADLPSPTPTKSSAQLADDGSKSVRPTPAPTSQWRTPCIVTHPATPVQVCRNRIGMLHFFYVGNGMIFSGPMFDSITKMASAYPFGHVPPEVELYRGINPGTGKVVVVHYLTYNRLLRVSTTYADNDYDVNKPYIFTIDEEGHVEHLTW